MKKNLNPEAAFKVLVTCPNVLITTVDEQGRINAAPFGAYTLLSRRPTLLGVAISSRQDTLANIRQTREFVLNVVHLDLAVAMFICAEKFPRGVNELEKAGLSWEKAQRVKPPLVSECRGHVECKFNREIPTGDHNLVIGEVVAVGAEAEFLDEDDFFDPVKTQVIQVVKYPERVFAVAGKLVDLSRC